MKTAQRRVACWITVLFVAVLTTVGALSAPVGSVHAAELLTLVGGTKRTLSDEGANPTISFPVELTTAGAAGAVSATVTEVLRDNVVLDETSVVASVVGDRQALELEVKDGTAFASTADYSITILLADASANRQGLTLTLSRPAASLAAGGVVEVVDFVGLFSKWNVDKRPTLEFAVERGAAIRSLSARQVERSEGQISLLAKCRVGNVTRPCPLATGQPVDLKSPVGGNGVLALGYELSEFPLGTTVRTVEVRSPQLGAPLTLSFKVTKRRSPLLIPLVVIIGLLAGLLVRKVLVFLISWSNREKARIELSALIEGFRRRYADPDFKQKLNDIDAKLNAKRLTLKHVEQLHKQVAEALDLVNAKLLSIRDDNNAIANAIAGTWTVPPKVLPAIVSIEEAIGGVRSYLNLRDAESANNQLLVANRKLENGHADALDWIGRYREAVTTAQKAIDGLNDVPVITDLRRSLDEAAQASVVDEAAQAKVVLDGADLRAALEATEKLTRDWQQDVEPSIISAIDAYAVRDPALAREALDALKASDPADRLLHSVGPLEKLLRLAQQSVTDNSRGITSLEAARTSLDEATTPVAAGEATAVLLPAYDIGALGQLGLLPYRVVAGAIGFFAALLLFVALASIIAAVAYATSAGDWVGGASQIIALFGWAFTIDVTVSAVVAMFGQSSPTPPTFATAQK